MKRIITAAFVATGALIVSPAYSLGDARDVGERGDPDKAMRTIQVTPETRDIGVSDSETVNLDMDGTVTPWKFSGRRQIVKLQDIVPGAPDVSVHVQPPADGSLPKG
jgi:hypothetical protein